MTLKELSKITGFSTKTISRVINSPELVKKETRETIEKAIKKYKYEPNRNAQALANNRTNKVILYMPQDLESTHPFVSHLVSGLVEALGKLGYGLVLNRTWYQNEPCDGLILVGLTIKDDNRLKELCKIKPVLLFGHSNVDCAWIDVDNYLGSYLMTQEVIKRGHKNLVYLGIDEPKRFAKDRLKGHRKAVLENKDKVKNSKEILISNRENQGYKTAMELLSKPNNIEAIICASDYIAIGVLRACNKLNIKVPKQLSITGFDGLGFENLTYPTITTIRQPIYEIGVELGTQIVNMINKKDYKKHIYFPPELIINKTLGER